MAREELRHIGGTTRVRFTGPDFKPREIARALDALHGVLQRAATLEYKQDPAFRRPRIEPVVRRLSAGDSWEVLLEYTVPAVQIGNLVVGPLVLWPGVAGRIARAFQRLGNAHGWDVEAEVDNADAKEVMERSEREDPRLADQVEKLWRVTLASAESAEIELLDGGVRISVPRRRRRS
jgi:hypothetical protein